MYESISSNPPLPFNYICSLSVLWNPLQVANPSVRREKHPQQFSTSTTTNVCSLNTKLQSKQNIIQHTKQSLRVFCSHSTVVCLFDSPHSKTLTSQASKQGGRNNSSSPSTWATSNVFSFRKLDWNLTLVPRKFLMWKYQSLRFFWSLTLFYSQQERCNRYWNLYRYKILLKIATYEERETLNHSTSTWTTPTSAASKNLTST
jgi:hypothetical protein